MNNENFNPGLAYSDYKQLQAVYVVAALTAYFLSCYFVVGYFAGNLHVLTWDAAQWAQAIPSAGLVAVMTAYQFFLYSQGDVAGGKKATIIAVVVAVAFSLLSEIGQGMERDNIRMETKSQESPTYKAAVAALGNLSGSSSIGASPYAADIANAQMKYNQCLERLAKGKEPHCEGSKGRLESYRQQEAEWADRASATSTNTATALLDQAKTMEKDERNYHPLVNAIREFFHVSGTIGSFLLSLTLISFFEYAFHYLGGRYAQAKAKLVQHGYDVTRKLRQPPRKHDGSMTTFNEQDSQTPTPQTDKPQGKPEYLLDSRWPTTPETSLQAMKKEFRGMVESAPAVIANEYARAQQSREQVYQKAADKLDGVQDGLNKAKAEKTLRQEYREGGKVYSDSPLDQPRPTADGADTERMPLPAMLKRIHADVVASGATSPEEIQAAVKTAYLNIANPTPMNQQMLQTVARNIGKQTEANRPTPTEKNTSGDVAENTSSDVAGHVSERSGLRQNTSDETHPETRQQVESARNWYSEWLNAIHHDETIEGRRDGKQTTLYVRKANGSKVWLMKRSASLPKDQKITPDEATELLTGFFERACDEGVLTERANWKPGQRDRYDYTA